MKHKIKPFIIIVLFFGVLVIGSILPERKETVFFENEDRVIVIDPGHGGKDPGKVSANGTQEKEINLAIAKKVKETLEANGIQVVMTRDEDVSLGRKSEDMRKRVQVIAESNPMAAVSIHQNSFSDSTVRGPQVFYFEGSKLGQEFARTMQNELWKIDEEHRREIKSNQNYYILKNTAVTTIIVECGFLSNEEEAALLAEDAYQEKLAQAICEGIIKWVDKCKE